VPDGPFLQRRRSAPPSPSDERACAYAAGMSRRAFLAIVALVSVVVLLAGCSGAGATPIVVYVTPPPAAVTPVATPVPDPSLGRVSFGTHFNAKTLLIDKGSMTFSRTASQVCWSASLSASPKHATVRQVIVQVGSGGVETAVRSQSDEVSNAALNLWANCEPFQAEVGYVKGSYMLRFLDGVTVLAEGRFVLK
jgi:hypothetical protein